MKIHFAFEIFFILLFLLLDFTSCILYLSVFVWEVCNSVDWEVELIYFHLDTVSLMDIFFMGHEPAILMADIIQKSFLFPAYDIE